MKAEDEYEGHIYCKVIHLNEKLLYHHCRAAVCVCVVVPSAGCNCTALRWLTKTTRTKYPEARTVTTFSPLQQPRPLTAALVSL